MKKIRFLVLFLALAGLVTAQSWRKSDAFLATAVDCALSTTVTNGTDFTSDSVPLSYLGYSSICAITVTFTRTTGSASTVDFEFQGSYDDGTTWTTAYVWRLQPPTNTTAVSNVVRYSELVNIYGFSHMRLYRIVNNDATYNLTDCNATMSIGAR